MIRRRSSLIVGQCRNLSLARAVLDTFRGPQLDEDESVVASTCLDRNHVAGLTGLGRSIVGYLEISVECQYFPMNTTRN